MARRLKFHVFRYNPLDKADSPKLQTYELEEFTGMTIFVALTMIRETIDPTLQFDFSCRAGICGSCGMVVNGRPTLACKTLTKTYANGEITLLPLPAFKLIGDLSVDTGSWMLNMSKKVQSWIVTSKEADINKIEEPMEPEKAEEVFNLERCIECGCCVAACGTARMRESFIGAVALLRTSRYEADPRDERTHEDFYEVIGDTNGSFGCMTLLGCEDACPKHLPLQTKIAYMRRKMVALGFA